MTVTGPVTIGIDVGGTKILGLAVDSAGVVLAEEKAPTPRVLAPEGTGDSGGDAVIETIVDVAERLIDGLATDGDGRGRSERVSAVGVGVPGLVDDDGWLRFAPNLPGGEGLDVKGRLSQRLAPVKVVVDNDATCAVMGEWIYGAAAGASDAVDRVSSRPDYSILGYPVISLVEPWTHQGSKDNLLGANPDPAARYRQGDVRDGSATKVP